LEEDLNYATSCGLIIRGTGGFDGVISTPSKNWKEKPKFIDKFKKILKKIIARIKTFLTMLK